jgi:histone H3/H4
MHPIKARRRHVTSRQSRHMPILPNSNTSIGVVPLAPAGLGTGTSSGPTDAELNSNRPPLSEDINTLPVETVQRIVKETLQQMGVEQVEVSQSHRRCRNHRSTNATRQLIKQQQDRMSPETDNEWKVCLVHIYYLISRNLSLNL